MQERLWELHHWVVRENINVRIDTGRYEKPACSLAMAGDAMLGGSLTQLGSQSYLTF